MSTKTLIVSDINFNFYHASNLDNKIKEVIISVANPSQGHIERLSNCGMSAQISLSSENMDKIAIAWIKKQKLEGVFGGPVGKEYGAADCGYD